MIWCDDYIFEVVNIKWERIFLSVSIKTDCPKIPEFALARYKRKLTNKAQVLEGIEEPVYEATTKEYIPINLEKIEGDVYHLVINMAAANGRSFLENGKWQIVAVTDDGLYDTNVTSEVGYSLENLDKIYKYGRDKYAYNVSFSLKKINENNMSLVINSYFMTLNSDWKKRRYVKEAKTKKGKLNRMGMYGAITLMRLYYKCLSSILPKKGNRILFMSETKEYLTGNLKYIYNRIKERKLDKEFKLTVSCRRAVGSHMSIASWVKTVTNLALHDYIFIDDYAPVLGFITLSEKTKLIQVWHAGEGFKSVGYSRFGKSGSPYPVESCHKAYDYALTGSKKLVHVYEEVFGIEKSAFLPVGMPRLDDFLNENKIKNFKEKFYGDYPELENKKIILFAPTFRGVGQKKAYYDYNKLDLERLYAFCKEKNYSILIKLHPFITKKIEIPEEYSDCIFDFGSYPDINELYYITDLMITDYSSNYYEYALMGNPVLFYTYDREIYELTRGVHRSVKEAAPGKVCDTFDEMMDCLYNEDFEHEKIKKFIEENFSEYDGHACDRAIDKILLKK